MTGKIRQWTCVLIICIPSVMASFSLVWPSYAIKIFEGNSSPLGYGITENEGSLIGSLPMLGSLASTILGGHISDTIGRKKTEILCGLLFTLSWAVITTAKTAVQILIGRVIAGAGIGLHYVTVTVFITEICQPTIRATAISTVLFMYSSGSLVSYLCGWLCSYQFICYLNLTLGVVFVVLMTCCSMETPIYFLRKGMEKEALTSLKFYRSASVITQEILLELAYKRSQCTNNYIVSSNTEKLLKTDTIEKLDEDITASKILLISKPEQRALVTITSVNVLTVFMGMIGVQVYAGKFFSMAGPGISPHLCSVILALVVTAAGGIAASVTDLFGRRVLMITSAMMTSVSSAVLASMLRWSWAPNWAVPLVTMCFCLTFHLGVNIVPLVQVGESFGPQMQSFATQVIVLSTFVANFIVLYLFRSAVDILGLDGIFFTFSLFGMLTTIIAYLILKETKGLSLETVQDMYRQGYLYRESK